jgi:hypothetical protein
MESILAHLPKTLRALNIRGIKLCPVHIQQLRHRTCHLQELALGKSISLENIEQLVYPRNGHNIFYLDLSDINVNFHELGKFLTPDTLPLRQIELCPNSYVFTYSRPLTDKGWVIREYCSRKSIFRICDMKKQLAVGGARKVAVSNAEVGFGYKPFMYG